MNTMNVKINENAVSEKLNKANSIEEFYANTGILVTGATGFVGKGILEKLIRVCPSIAAIFILMRPKKNQTIKQRFKKLIDDPIYDSVRVKHPSVLNRIHPVHGDVSLPNLDLSPENRIMLIEKVNIVFHIAATVKFNEPLNVAVNINTAGTARIIQLCKELKHVISITYVSTAYSNANLSEIGEKVYTSSFETSMVIDICEKGDKTLINLFEKKILKIYPNTYTFSKNLAEQIVSSNSDSLPIAIVRPSIIGASIENPCLGWLDNIYGVTAIFMTVGMGITKVIPAKENASVDLVPIDFVVDTILCAAWHVTLRPNNEVKVYNCTNDGRPLKWGQMINIAVKCNREMPMNKVFWYPCCFLVANRYVYNVLNIFLHILPAFVVDMYLKLSDKTPIMVKGSKRFNELVANAQYFSMNEWTFHGDNVRKMMVDVETLKDSEIVKLNRDVDWERYITIYMAGIEKFILKEKFKSIDASRQRLSVLYWIHQIIQIFGKIAILAIILYTIY
ncbi:hypothetical protein QLX08_010397 [Tetragonisca angustula]|uniref:Fatty acyl-CoA reductase n=1 Tax=Tetragonisca angustula TaxID=166442 RepID=A0AAW0ZD61_9HYME